MALRMLEIVGDIKTLARCRNVLDQRRVTDVWQLTGAVHTHSAEGSGGGGSSHGRAGGKHTGPLSPLRSLAHACVHHSHPARVAPESGATPPTCKPVNCVV